MKIRRIKQTAHLREILINDEHRISQLIAAVIGLREALSLVKARTTDPWVVHKASDALNAFTVDGEGVKND
jgi:hypothetical protein